MLLMKRNDAEKDLEFNLAKAPSLKKAKYKEKFKLKPPLFLNISYARFAQKPKKVLR